MHLKRKKTKTKKKRVYFPVNKIHASLLSAILQSIQKTLPTYLLRLTRCCHKSYSSNKVQIYGKCFRHFTSIRSPALKLIIDESLGKIQNSNIKLSQKNDYAPKSHLSGSFITVVLTRTELIIAKAKETGAVSISVDRVKADIFMLNVS